MSPNSASERRGRLLRDYVIATFLQVIATALALFLILRVFVPWLVDRQDTALLWVAGALALACPVLLAQLVYAIWRGRRRLGRRLQELRAADSDEGRFGGYLT